MKNKTTETFPIIDGPKHWFDLALCLGDPFPTPQQMLHGYSGGGTRHPGFIMNTEGIHAKRQNKIREEIIRCLQIYWEKPPIRIIGLSRGKADELWNFRGILTTPSGSLGGLPTEVPARGWYNVTTSKGKITFSKPKTRT